MHKISKHQIKKPRPYPKKLRNPCFPLGFLDFQKLDFQKFGQTCLLFFVELVLVAQSVWFDILDIKQGTTQLYHVKK